MTGDGHPPLRLAHEMAREIWQLALVQEQLIAVQRKCDEAPTPCLQTEKKRSPAAALEK